MKTKEVPPQVVVSGDSENISPNVLPLIYSKELKQQIPIPQDPQALMDETAAAAFLNLTRRGLQNFRLTGEGPRYVRISSRCIKYRKIDLISWQESKLRTSTSDQGEEVGG